MTTRLGIWVLRMLICVDQLVGCWLRGWYYVWIGGEPPSSDETISAWVGRNSLEGKRWANVARVLIEQLFGEGHCVRAIGHDDLD